MARGSLVLVLCTMCLIGSMVDARSVKRSLLQTDNYDLLKATDPAPECDAIDRDLSVTCGNTLFGALGKCTRCLGGSGCCMSPHSSMFGECAVANRNICPSGKPVSCSGASCPSGLSCQLYDQNCNPGQTDCFGQTKCTNVGGCKAGSKFYKEGWFCRVSGANKVISVCADCVRGRQCWGDPHIRGFDGSHFMFKGWPEAVFNMFTHENYQINALLDNYMKIQNNSAMKTWIEEIGIKVGSQDEISVKALGKGKLSVMVNGEDFNLNDFKKLNSATATVQYLLRDDVGEKVVVETQDMTMIVSSTTFNLNLDIPYISTSLGNVHGILGQSYHRMVEQSETLAHTIKGVEGTDEDYFVAEGLFGDSFTYNLYTGKDLVAKDTQGIKLQLASTFN